MSNDQPEPLWIPSAERCGRAHITDYIQWLGREYKLSFKNYDDLWRWSVGDHMEDFYKSIWEYFRIPHSSPYTKVLGDHGMPGAQWFCGARLNFAELVFQQHVEDPQRPAIIARSEARQEQVVTWAELRRQVTAVAAGLRLLGVKSGDRVASYLPNVPETMIAFLATCSVGAIWSSCSPDTGTRGVLDRFRQIAPKVLFVADGYRYGGKDYDRLSVADQLHRELPSVEHVVLLPYLHGDASLEGACQWSDLPVEGSKMHFEQVAFDHPLWVVYSSGTTGIPKAIVHSHGGALIRSLIDMNLQLDLGEDDRFMWFTTTGWIMWNAQMSGLLTGSTICLYDGNPGYPDLQVLWDFVDQADVSLFGAGSAYFQKCQKALIDPGKRARSHALKSIGATGSPLSQSCYRWINQQFPRAMIACISGGTDVATAYVGACPILPVYPGEMQCRYLGTAVYAMDESGRIVEDEVGELVVTKPMPSMPLYFWHDPDGQRYHDSYFNVFPHIWRHGDWLRITPRGTAIIYGRSDTTINRHGVRMGTSEIYRVVEAFPEILDSLVVDLEYLGRESYMPLFVVLQGKQLLDAMLINRIKEAIRVQLSPRHVPDDIVAIPDVPRTLSGKKMELPIKRLLLGEPLRKVASPDAMANPESLEAFLAFAAQRATAIGRRSAVDKRRL